MGLYQKWCEVSLFQVKFGVYVFMNFNIYKLNMLIYDNRNIENLFKCFLIYYEDNLVGKLFGNLVCNI